MVVKVIRVVKIVLRGGLRPLLRVLELIQQRADLIFELGVPGGGGGFAVLRKFGGADVCGAVLHEGGGGCPEQGGELGVVFDGDVVAVRERAVDGLEEVILVRGGGLAGLVLVGVVDGVGGGFGGGEGGDGVELADGFGGDLAGPLGDLGAVGVVLAADESQDVLDEEGNTFLDQCRDLDIVDVPELMDEVRQRLGQFFGEDLARRRGRIAFQGAGPAKEDREDVIPVRIEIFGEIVGCVLAVGIARAGWNLRVLGNAREAFFGVVVIARNHTS